MGNQADAPDVATAAENLHNTYAAMSEKRQRRFWVRFFIGHPTIGKMICLKCIKHQLAASAAHSVVNHYLG